MAKNNIKNSGKYSFHFSYAQGDEDNGLPFRPFLANIGIFNI